ncbi:DUF5348 domain-containing protein [Clostridium tunisiense]|uniref:DUF5348 domain-containing protein n=1 Tax=Clostridium tunisiense TaxID=219748 RepID=UPI0002FD3C77|nr:DUF5348 domain-containing protein [Clostridium tunisiense]
MENLIEHLESFIGEIKHYSKVVMEGCLSLNINKRYSINNIELTCGQPIEAYNPQYGQWEAGRVEHSNKYDGYYFYNYDDRHKALFNGMKVRIRI